MGEKGQLILTLILVMTVALAIGLSVVQKSLVDVSTSTKVEQSSRAFSAAEAGIEKALRGDTSGVNFPETNSYAPPVVDTNLIPCTPGVGVCPAGQQDPLEYPPLAKEDIVQIWLADYTSTNNPPPFFYTQNSLDVYWGNSPGERPAIELTFVYYGTDSSDTVDGSTTKYRSRKIYLDPDATRASNTNFTHVNCTGGGVLPNYQCHRPVTGLPPGLMLVRARLLYNSASQPLAVRAVGTCGRNCSLPPQAREITSTGVSGETQRKVKLFQLNKVVPPYFDYAIFSAGKIEK